MATPAFTPEQIAALIALLPPTTAPDALSAAGPSGTGAPPPALPPVLTRAGSAARTEGPNGLPDLGLPDLGLPGPAALGLPGPVALGLPGVAELDALIAALGRGEAVPELGDLLLRVRAMQLVPTADPGALALTPAAQHNAAYAAAMPTPMGLPPHLQAFAAPVLPLQPALPLLPAPVARPTSDLQAAFAATLADPLSPAVPAVNPHNILNDPIFASMMVEMYQERKARRELAERETANKARGELLQTNFVLIAEELKSKGILSVSALNELVSDLRKAALPALPNAQHTMPRMFTARAQPSAFMPNIKDRPRTWDGKGVRTPEQWMAHMLRAYGAEQVALDRLPFNMSDEVSVKWDAIEKQFIQRGLVMSWADALVEFVRMEGGEKGAIKIAAKQALLGNFIRQSGTYQQYVADLRAKLVLVPDMDEATKVFVFQNGLSADLQWKCIRNPQGDEWRTVEEAIKFGYAASDILAATLSGNKRPALLLTPGAPDATGANAFTPGHADKRHKRTPQVGGGRSRGGGDREHHNSPPPQRGRERSNDRGGGSNDAPRRPRMTPAEYVDYMKDQICSTCQGKGHYSRDCPNNKRGDNKGGNRNSR